MRWGPGLWLDSGGEGVGSGCHGAGLGCERANECVNVYLKWGAYSFHQFSEGLRPMGSSEPLVGQHGPPGPLGWRWLGTQAAEGRSDTGSAPCPLSCPW